MDMGGQISPLKTEEVAKVCRIRKIVLTYMDLSRQGQWVLGSLAITFVGRYHSW